MAKKTSRTKKKRIVALLSDGKLSYDLIALKTDSEISYVKSIEKKLG